MNGVVGEMEKERILLPIVDNLESFIGESIGQKVTLLPPGGIFSTERFPW